MRGQPVLALVCGLLAGAATAPPAAFGQPFPNDRQARAIEVWQNALPQIQQSYSTPEGTVQLTGWMNRDLPVAITERRLRGPQGDVTGTWYFDGRTLIRYREDGLQSVPGDAAPQSFSLVVDFANDVVAAVRKTVGPVPAIPAEAELEAIVRQGAMAYARLGAPVQPQPRPAASGAFGLAAPAGGRGPAAGDYRRPVAAEAQWLRDVAGLLPAVQYCLAWYGGPMQVAHVWPLEEQRAGVRLVDQAGGRVDCVALRDGSRGWLLAALSPDAPLAAGEGEAVFTPAGREVPAGACLAAQPLSAAGGSSFGTVTTRRC
jgi:hypothetical protein